MSTTLRTVLLLCLWCGAPIWAHAATYYVSPSGIDTNPGTQVSPWKSFQKAAATLVAGDTALFADGTYVETQRGVIGHSGTVSAPIVFQSQTPHGAVLLYQGLPLTWGKIYSNQSYITIQDFEITQDAQGSTASDVLVFFDNTTGGGGNDPPTTGNKFLRNRVHTAYFTLLKIYASSNFLAEGNTFFDSQTAAFSATNALNPVFRNNIITGVTTTLDGDGVPIGGAAAYMKGGTRSGQIVNNVIHFVTGERLLDGITIGGTTGNTAVFDDTVNGYECFNCLAYNNVVVSDDLGGVYFGIRMIGAKDSAIYNNVIRGAEYALFLQKSNGDMVNNGWAWDPRVKNPLIKNNIVMNCKNNGETHTCVYLGGVLDIEGVVTHDYNLYFNTSGAETFFPPETHGVYADPLFVNPLSDWHLQSSSPALRVAPAVTFTGWASESIDLTRDAAGRRRRIPWDLGIYEHRACVSCVGVTP